MKKILILLFITTLSNCKTDYSEFMVIKEPRIRILPAHREMTIELKGDPNETAKKGFSTLMKLSYKLDSGREKLIDAIPRARWPKGFNTSREEWIGIFAIPISDTSGEIPEEEMIKNPELKIVSIPDTQVAEILHIGPYTAEFPMVEKLHKFIDENGYRIAGYHEEVYVKGPGMFFKGNEKEYLTIIRYPIKKK